MKRVTVICDACGKEIQPSYFRSARLEFRIDNSIDGIVTLFLRFRHSLFPSRNYQY